MSDRHFSETLTALAIPASEIRSNSNLSINSHLSQLIIIFWEFSTNCGATTLSTLD